ncbi:hypothetical protein [Bradyrhizobium sp. HKCCYLS2033]|uniref:hypothetical protein n=1 Tax=unclassified Bradyrhizobium TaxID=2631580 RepID=UPI003EB8FDDB
MAEATQFTFELREVTETLLKKQEIHEGKWLLSVEFTINAGFMGLSPETGRPGVVMWANTLQLVRAQEGAPANLIVDAAVVNPKS